MDRNVRLRQSVNTFNFNARAAGPIGFQLTLSDIIITDITNYLHAGGLSVNIHNYARENKVREGNVGRKLVFTVRKMNNFPDTDTIERE